MLEAILTRARRIKHSLFPEAGRVPLRYFARHLPADPVIVEAGAHNGVDTCEMAHKWPGGCIYAFEPIPELYNVVQTRIAGLRNVVCFPQALGESDGTAEFFVSGGDSDGSSSLLRPSGHLTSFPKVRFDKTIRVPVTTLDQWAEKTKIRRVDFLWLDLQGGELAALRGAAKLLANVTLVYTEVLLAPLYEGAPLYPEFASWMRDRGFRVIREELPWPEVGNVVFAR
jgi:FkbM family methyltransferase